MVMLNGFRQSSCLRSRHETTVRGGGLLVIILCCLLLLVSWGHGDTIPPLEVINGSFELPGDTWLTGGGIPDGWTIENFQVVIGTEAGEGNIGLNHRWIGSPVDGGRSLYLINPAGAIVKQELQGTMVTGVTYTLRYEYFSYDYWNHATITASLKRGGQVLATQTFTGDDFPIRQWELRELSYTAVAEDQDMPLTVSFEISGVGDVRLDGVYVFTITPEIAALNMKLQEYTQVVAGLPESTDREKQKKAILELGLERAVHASEAYMIEEYRTLLEDVNEVTVQPISDRPTPNLSEALLPELKTVQSNPYLEAIYTWAGDTLAGPDLTYKKATETYNPFSDFGDARAEGANMNLFFWLAAHSQSRYNADSECIVRLFRRLHTYYEKEML